jgi:hypothetical protein
MDHDEHGPIRNAFEKIHYEGEWKGVSPCEMTSSRQASAIKVPKKVAMLCHTRTKQHLNLALALALWNHLTVVHTIGFLIQAKPPWQPSLTQWPQTYYTACNFILESRKYWIIYRRPGFLAAVSFGSSSSPFPPVSIQEARPATQRKIEKERQLADGRDAGKGMGEEPTTARKPFPL